MKIHLNLVAISELHIRHLYLFKAAFFECLLVKVASEIDSSGSVLSKLWEEWREGLSVHHCLNHEGGWLEPFGDHLEEALCQ